MARYTEPSKKGIISLLVMMFLIVLVVAGSGPIYRALSGEGSGIAYSSVQQGYGGEVKVTLVVSNGKIKQLTAEGHSETPGIGQKAIAQYNETTFSELSGTEVSSAKTLLDAISGATITSGAVSSGYQDVLEQAMNSETE